MAGSVGTLQDYSVFQQNYITKVINDLIVDPKTYGAIDKYIPTRDQPVALGTDIQWDEEFFVGGMTKPSDVDAASPIIGGVGARTRKWTPPHFREKAIIGGKDILNMRQLGTANKPRELSIEVNKWIQRLRVNVDNRIYWYKWEVVQNSAAFNLIGNNVLIPMNYSTFGFHPTVGVSWDGALPTILDDIIGFIAQFRTASCYPQEAFFGSNVLQVMLADATLRGLIIAQIGHRVNDDNIFNVTPGQAGLSDFLQSMFAGITFNYYPVGPEVSLISVIPNPGGPVATVVDGNIELFAVGDVVNVKQPNGARTTATLTNVSIPNHTITGPLAHARGTIISKKMEFLHADRFVIMAQMPPGQLGGQETAEFVNVANFHGDGGIANMQSGVVGKTINKEKEDPPSIEMVASFTGGVVVYHPDGPWSGARVIF